MNRGGEPAKIALGLLKLTVPQQVSGLGRLAQQRGDALGEKHEGEQTQRGGHDDPVVIDQPRRRSCGVVLACSPTHTKTITTVMNGTVANTVNTASDSTKVAIDTSIEAARDPTESNTRAFIGLNHTTPRKSTKMAPGPMSAILSNTAGGVVSALSS